jgi:hypothetical protein
MGSTEDDAVTALRAAGDQYGMSLRDLMAGAPGLAGLAGAMAAVVEGQCPGADGRALIAAAQAADGAVALFEQGGGALDPEGVVTLIALAGRALVEREAESPG